jgi:PAS domain-containing protein
MSMEPTAPPDTTALDELAQVLLDVAPTGIILLRPIYDAGGEHIIDISFEYLNLAAQRKLLLPAQPTESLRDLFPDDERLLAFYREAYLSGERSCYEGTRQVTGLTFVFHLVAQRQGPRLVVSVTATTDHSAEAVAEALHASQAREQAARQLAERQLQDTTLFFEQAPVAISLLRGPQHIVELMNEANATLLGSTPEKLLGRPIMDALPVLHGQSFDLVLQCWRAKPLCLRKYP